MSESDGSGCVHTHVVQKDDVDNEYKVEHGFRKDDVLEWASKTLTGKVHFINPQQLVGSPVDIPFSPGNPAQGVLAVSTGKVEYEIYVDEGGVSKKAHSGIIIIIDP
jgi:hypothetical protein